MRDQRDELKAEIGARLKQAAHEAGLSADEVAQRMGVSVQTIYNWWRGGRQPDLVDLQRYAETVGREPGWFFDPDRQRVEQATDLVMRIVWRTMEGEDLARARDAVVGNGSSPLSPRERRTLSAGTEGVRDHLIRQMGWGSLPFEEQAQRLRQLLNDLQHEA